MKGAIRSSWWLAVAVTLVLCCTHPAFAQFGDPQFAITSATGSLWGEYTSPYGTDNVGNVVCDDFADSVYFGVEHNYNSISLNSLISLGMGGIWSASGNPYSSSITTLYEAAGYLVLQIYGSSGLNQEYANWALWALFDSTDALNFMNGHQDVNSQAGCNAIFGAGSYSGGKCNGGNGGYIGAALAGGAADYGNGNGAFNNLVLYIPFNKSLTGPCNSPGNCDSQEFFGMVPEGGSAALYLLLAGVSCLGAMVYSRRQTARANMA